MDMDMQFYLVRNKNTQAISSLVGQRWKNHHECWHHLWMTVTSIWPQTWWAPERGDGVKKLSTSFLRRTPLIRLRNGEDSGNHFWTCLECWNDTVPDDSVLYLLQWVHCDAAVLKFSFVLKCVKTSEDRHAVFVFSPLSDQGAELPQASRGHVWMWGSALCLLQQAEPCSLDLHIFYSIEWPCRIIKCPFRRAGSPH